jgi:hypothetical protein
MHAGIATPQEALITFIIPGQPHIVCWRVVCICTLLLGWLHSLSRAASATAPHRCVLYMLSCSALVFFLFKHQCGRLVAPHQGDFNLLTSFPNFPVNYLSFWRGSSKY